MPQTQQQRLEQKVEQEVRTLEEFIEAKIQEATQITTGEVLVRLSEARRALIHELLAQA